MLDKNNDIDDGGRELLDKNNDIDASGREIFDKNNEINAGGREILDAVPLLLLVGESLTVVGGGIPYAFWWGNPLRLLVGIPYGETADSNLARTRFLHRK